MKAGRTWANDAVFVFRAVRVTGVSAALLKPLAEVALSGRAGGRGVRGRLPPGRAEHVAKAVP